MKKPASVAAYIADQPPAVRAQLRKLRAAIRKAAPDADETISYGVPAFTQGGILVWYAAFKDHLSVFPKTAAIRRFQRELARFTVSKGTIHLPLDKPLPLGLIRKIVKFRVVAVTAK